MKEQRKGGKVLFPTALRDSLAGTISEAVATASLAGTLRPGLGRRDLFYVGWLCQRHMILG
jgi:hypothetical protein